MKEILFRGKRTDNLEWVYGYYFQKENPKTVDGLPVTHCISDLPPFGYGVVPGTVSQFTGRKDKNGKRIFEGDIVTTRTGRRCLVRWFSSDAEQAFDLVPCECEHPCPQAWDLWRAENLEVVGNKWDNPDLTGGLK